MPYGQSLPLKEILDTGRAEIKAEHAAIAKKLSEIDRYKTVMQVRNDESGIQLIGDCQRLYFFDNDRVIERGWCINDANTSVDLVVYSRG